ncbi:hypothetical protein RB628_20440 [Streptomyces sp. ADMS]|uniref:hypothetical protein n=1 Tax=Streptomyces sp. ADMS TaxID=3071415 RepID=UPI00296F85B4|nr:hypothetical protein [Streptomyces sp. ADMS]MDW4907652.1 hypothetical protein [Streptomyces sp. ADMS]
MAERSAAALPWVVVTLILWGLARLLPPTGTHRKASASMRAFVTSKNTGEPACSAVQVPGARRSPYSIDRAPLDGSASPLSRPYLPCLDRVPERQTVMASRTARVRPHWAARERVVRWRRRAVTVSAVGLGIDVDTRDIHAELDGARAR